MSGATLYGLCSAALVGLGLFGAIVHPQPLRKLLAFNLLGGGVFLQFGVIARRGAAAGMGGDPVPQAMVITGIVVLAWVAIGLGFCGLGFMALGYFNPDYLHHLHII